MPGIRVDVRFQGDLSARCTGPLDNLIKFGYLEPKQDAMARRRSSGVDEVGVSFVIPSVELKNELAAAQHSLVHVAMRMFGKCIEPEQLLIPTTAGPNVAHSNERLTPDGGALGVSFHMPSR